jgi:cytochrome c2
MSDLSHDPPARRPKLAVFEGALAAILALLALGAVVIVTCEGSSEARRRLDTAVALTGGDARRGKLLIVEMGCGGCHQIPGIGGADGRVGPNLSDLSERVYVAGMLQNTPENLIHWIRAPREVNPRTAMPDLGLDEEGARDIAAYLYAAPL